MFLSLYHFFKFVNQWYRNTIELPGCVVISEEDSNNKSVFILLINYNGVMKEAASILGLCVTSVKRVHVLMIKKPRYFS